MKSQVPMKSWRSGVLVAVSALGLIAGSSTLSACGDDSTGEGNAEQAFFPANYADSYSEVRNCRASGDHDLNMVRMLADPAALGPYEGREDPFPTGSVVIKEEFDFADSDCSGPIKQWTVMQKLAAGTSSETLGWAWQQVDAERRVVSSDAQRCISCHTGCGVPPDGYDGTCAMP